MSSVRLGLVWAQANGGVIGADGGMPWHVPEDLAHFKAVTAGRPVVMGRKTWDSLPERFRPLPGRRNIVVTRQDAWGAEGAERVGSLEEALAGLDGDVWVTGGGELYCEAMPHADRLEVTEIDLDVDGDAHAPAIDASEWRVDAREPDDRGWLTSRTGTRYRFLSLTRP